MFIYIFFIVFSDPEDPVAMALYVTDVCSKFYPSNIVKWNGIVDWNYLETNHKKKDSIMVGKFHL